MDSSTQTGSVGSSEANNSEKITISISGVIQDLKNGITRYPTDNAYDASRGSIQEKYGLTASEVREMFKHPLLKDRRVSQPREGRVVLIDDITEQVETQTSVEVTEEQEEKVETQETPETPESEATHEGHEEQLAETYVEDPQVANADF